MDSFFVAIGIIYNGVDTGGGGGGGGGGGFGGLNEHVLNKTSITYV